MPFGFNPDDTPPYTPGTGLPVVPTDPGTGGGGTTTPTTTVTVVDAYTKKQSDDTFQAKADFPRWNRINTIPVGTNDYSIYDGFDTLGLAVSNFAFWALNSLNRQEPSLRINGAIPFWSRLLFSGKGSNLPEYGILWIKNNNMANYLGFQRSSTQSINYSVAQKQSDGTVKWYHFEDPHSDANNKLVLSNGTTSSQWWVADGTNGKPALRLIADGFLQVTTRGKRWIIEGDIEGVYDVPYLTGVQLTNSGTGGAAQVDGTVGIRALKGNTGVTVAYDANSKCNLITCQLANVGDGAAQVEGTVGIRSLKGGTGGVTVTYDSTSKCNVINVPVLTFSSPTSNNGDYQVTDLKPGGFYNLSNDGSSSYKLTYDFLKGFNLDSFGYCGVAYALNSTGNKIQVRAYIYNYNGSNYRLRLFSSRPDYVLQDIYYGGGGTPPFYGVARKSPISVVNSLLSWANWSDAYIPAEAYIEIKWKGRVVDITTEWTGA